MLIVGCLLLWSGSAFAGGWGAYIEYGRDWATNGGDLSGLTSAQLEAFNRNELGVGLVYDTNLAKDSLLNYRIDFGYHRAAFADSTSNLLLGASNGVMINQALGFGLLRNSLFRLWVGPALRGNIDYFGQTDLFNGEVGIGPQAGFNLHLGDRFSAVVTMAYNYKWGWFVQTNGFTGFGTSTHRDNVLTVNLAFFFRGSEDKFQ